MTTGNLFTRRDCATWSREKLGQPRDCIYIQEADYIFLMALSDWRIE